MDFLEQLRAAGISDLDIINTFQYKAGGYSQNGKGSYIFGSTDNSDSIWGEIHFNKYGKLYKITPRKLLVSPKSQSEFIENTLNEINGEHGYNISHRILFSQKPLKGQFQWRNNFRIRPCQNFSQVGKDLAWGIANKNIDGSESHLGPPYPFILEVRTKKSPNFIIQNNRVMEALDFYQWLLGLLIPHQLGSPIGRNGQPKWTMLKKDGAPEYHLAHEAFNAHESEIENGEEFQDYSIPEVARYTGSVDYYNHLWVRADQIELPNDIEYYLELVDNLNPETKEDFRRSTYWFNVGSRFYGEEELSVIPFTIAIECLAPDMPNEPCPTCKKSTGNGPTKFFNDFLENHLSLPEDISHLRKSIYPRRSSIVHGSFASRADQGFYSIGNFNNSEFITENFVRRSIINWLTKS